MHKMMLLAAACAVTAFFCGCASVQEATPKDLNSEGIAVTGNTVAHLNAENWGLYFFVFPLITGSTDKPGEMEFLKDTVRVENVANLLTRKSKEMGATQTLNLVSRHNTFVWWFGFRDVQISANAVK